MRSPVSLPLTSSPAMIHAGSRVLYRPISTSVLSRPEVRTEFQTSAISRDIDTAAKCIGAGAATVILAGSGAGLLQQLFSYAILGFTLSEAMGLSCLMVAFLILFAM
uniref:ATP synthase lipid-binding protein n=1 Tax=Chelydra serpentina TaxID=8475 RepID=A0A8C3SVH2_CHESE